MLHLREDPTGLLTGALAGTRRAMRIAPRTAPRARRRQRVCLNALLAAFLVFRCSHLENTECTESCTASIAAILCVPCRMGCRSEVQQLTLHAWIQEGIRLRRQRRAHAKQTLRRAARAMRMRGRPALRRLRSPVAASSRSRTLTRTQRRPRALRPAAEEETVMDRRRKKRLGVSAVSVRAGGGSQLRASAAAQPRWGPDAKLPAE